MTSPPNSTFQMKDDHPLGILFPLARREPRGRACVPSLRTGWVKHLRLPSTCTLMAFSATLNHTLTTSASWIVISPQGGSGVPNRTATIRISLNPAALGPGANANISTSTPSYRLDQGNDSE